MGPERHRCVRSPSSFPPPSCDAAQSTHRPHRPPPPPPCRPSPDHVSLHCSSRHQYVGSICALRRAREASERRLKDGAGLDDTHRRVPRLPHRPPCTRREAPADVRAARPRHLAARHAPFVHCRCGCSDICAERRRCKHAAPHGARRGLARCFALCCERPDWWSRRTCRSRRVSERARITGANAARRAAIRAACLAARSNAENGDARRCSTRGQQRCHVGCCARLRAAPQCDGRRDAH